MEWFTSHPSQFLITLGIVLLIIEVVIMGFATFILTFVSLSLIVTGGLVYLGVLPSDIMTVVISNAVLASLFALVLWKPLKQFQNKKEPNNVVKNDLIGLSFTLDADIDVSASGKHRLSGVDWTIKSNEAIVSGSLVVVEKAEVGTLWVVKSS